MTNFRSLKIIKPAGAWIYFRKAADLSKTTKWDVLTVKGLDFLGRIRYHAPWRQYVFDPAGLTIFEEDCLRHIREFLIALDADRRKSLTKCRNSPIDLKGKGK